MDTVDYLPPDTDERASPKPDTQSNWKHGSDGRLSWPGWLVTNGKI